MNDQIERLKIVITEFLTDNIEAFEFEERFTEIYDLEDLEVDEITKYYFLQVRQILERYSSSQNDLKNFPTYYISDKQLKERIAVLKKSNNHNATHNKQL